MTKENHLTEKDLAKRWNLNVRTLQKKRWNNEGPPHIRIYGRIRYRLEAIETFEKEHSNLIHKKRSPIQNQEVAYA
jgi:hypothetical protein